TSKPAFASSLGAFSTPAATTNTGLGFGSSGTGKPALSFGAPTASSTTTSSGLNFGFAKPPFGAAASTTAPNAAFGISAFAAQKSDTTTAPIPSLSKTDPKSGFSGLGLPQPASTALSSTPAATLSFFSKPTGDN